jgi:hypothetical protein
MESCSTSPPSMVDPEDAKGIDIPFTVLTSGEEDMTAIKKFLIRILVRISRERKCWRHLRTLFMDGWVPGELYA